MPRRMSMLVGCIVLALAGPAGAQTQQQMDWCSDKGNPPSLEHRIDSCLAAIRSGRWSGRDLSWAYANLCDIYIRKQDLDTAIAECNRAIQLHPDQPDAHYNKCVAYIAKQQYPNAIAACNEALRVNANDSQAYTNRGLAHDRMGNLDQAVADYRKACSYGEPYACENLRKLGKSP